MRQILDHLYFAVIYAIPNLSFSAAHIGFGPDSEKYELIMKAKLEMQKRVYNEKQNLFKVIIGKEKTLNEDQFLTLFEKKKLL